LFLAHPLAVSGRNQPLLLVIDEAHRFVPEGSTTSASRTLATIAKEGRKYGVGLMLVSQRPTELDHAILSQCGSIVALRLTSPSDRARVAAALPDDLGGLVGLLPSLRTGEALCVGDLIPIPSRVRVNRATNKPVGNDPQVDVAWQRPRTTDQIVYHEAVRRWRAQQLSTPGDK